MNPFKILLGVGAVALVGAAIFHERNSFECDTCHSQRNDWQWRAGLWMAGSVPLTPVSEHLRLSHLHDDLFAPGHVHSWSFAQGSPYYWFGTSWAGCALGGGRNSSILSWRFERRPTFRANLLARIADGRLDRGLAIRLLSLTRQPDPEQEADLSKVYLALLDECEHS